MITIMKEWDVIIIGAGPAGLFAAAECGAEGLKTCILESNRSAGKKLLVTGQGKCNITNSAELSNFITHYGTKTRFVRKCLYAFSNRDMIELFTKTGLPLEARADGKVFPVSEQASDVREYLLGLCRTAKVTIKYNSSIGRIAHVDGLFSAFSDEEKPSATATPIATAAKLIIATGGYTLPSTGSNGSGYNLARMLGHELVAPRPSLTGIVVEPEDFTPFITCAGIALDCELNLYRDNSKVGNYIGRILFTHKGLSGPVIIDNSRDFLQGDELQINLVPGRNSESLSADFISYCSMKGKTSIKHFFTDCKLPDRLISSVFSRSGAEAARSEKSADIKASDRKKLVNAFTALSFGLKSPEGRSKAMCTAGGLDTSEINPATMESRLITSLYFAGEIIDVDGDSGGYNLQFAFSSGRAAAKSILNQKQVDVET